ncbi:MAG: DUF885 domain-containing protein [Vicinamibacteria bacterium]
MSFASWLDRFFDSYYRRHPVNATFIGFHERDHALPDFSERGASSHLEEIRSLRRELEALPGEALSASQSIDRDLARGFLEIEKWELESGYLYRRNPAFYTGEAVFGVFSLLLREFAPRRERYGAAAERLSAIPRFLEEARGNLRVAPRPWTERALRECDGALQFFDDGLSVLEASTELSRPAVAARSAFVAFRDYLERGLLDSKSEDYRCGEEAFGRLLGQAHFLDWTSEEILERASESLRSSEAELSSGAPAFGSADWRQVLASLEDVHPQSDESYQRYRELWEESRSLVIERDLLTWPDYPIDFVPQPAWARSAAPKLYFLFYRSPAPLDGLRRVDYQVPPAPTHESAIKLNHVAHHGGLGHHIQNWHAMRAPSRIGRIAAVDCASRIAMLCGGTMAEGWASYATELLDEAGFLTPLESFSEHHARARAAARAIVDVEIHRGGMSFEEAESFYQKRTNMSPGAARAEVTKNTMFPGAALIYFVGRTLIRDLRREMEPRIGLREFHDRFLAHGSIPVALVSRSMRMKTA